MGKAFIILLIICFKESMDGVIGAPAKAHQKAIGPRPSFKGMFDPEIVKNNRKILNIPAAATQKQVPKISSLLKRHPDLEQDTKDALNSFAKKQQEKVSEPVAFGPKPSNPVWLMSLNELQTETCSISTFNRTVKSRGCISAIVNMNYCSGRCNSFSVPSDKGMVQFCSNCVPDKVRRVGVILECPGRVRGYKIKHIQLIERCKCKSAPSCQQ